jgi:hypothetical protein
MPPVLNPYTRLAVEMCPAAGTLRVVGYEMAADAELPQAVTLVGGRDAMQNRDVMQDRAS